MGTRNLTMVVRDGLFEVAQYCQWDGYPKGQGVTVLDFCRKFLGTKKGRAEFGKKLDKVVPITEEELMARWRAVGHTGGDFVSLPIADKFKAEWPELYRDCGADILNHILQREEAPKVRLDVEFAADSLFCEWAYLIDLTKNVLEVYRGFNKRPLGKGQRFRSLPLREPTPSVPQYYQIRMIKSYSLSRLPTEKKFLADLVPADEE